MAGFQDAPIFKTKPGTIARNKAGNWLPGGAKGQQLATKYLGKKYTAKDVKIATEQHKRAVGLYPKATTAASRERVRRAQTKTFGRAQAVRAAAVATSGFQGSSAEANLKPGMIGSRSGLKATKAALASTGASRQARVPAGSPRGGQFKGK